MEKAKYIVVTKSDKESRTSKYIQALEETIKQKKLNITI